MLGFTSTGNEALVSCLGDPQRAVAAYHELLRRGQDVAAPASGPCRGGPADLGGKPGTWYQRHLAAG